MQRKLFEASLSKYIPNSEVRSFARAEDILDIMNGEVLPDMIIIDHDLKKAGDTNFKNG